MELSLSARCRWRRRLRTSFGSYQISESVWQFMRDNWLSNRMFRLSSITAGSLGTGASIDLGALCSSECVIGCFWPAAGFADTRLLAVDCPGRCGAASCGASSPPDRHDESISDELCHHLGLTPADFFSLCLWRIEALPLRRLAQREGDGVHRQHRVQRPSIRCRTRCAHSLPQFPAQASR